MHLVQKHLFVSQLHKIPGFSTSLVLVDDSTKRLLFGLRNDISLQIYNPCYKWSIGLETVILLSRKLGNPTP